MLHLLFVRFFHVSFLIALIAMVFSGLLTAGCSGSCCDCGEADGDIEPNPLGWCKNWETNAEISSALSDTHMELRISGLQLIDDDTPLVEGRFCYLDFPDICTDITLSAVGSREDPDMLTLHWFFLNDLSDFLLPGRITLTATTAADGEECGTLSIDTPPLSAPFQTGDLNETTRLDDNQATYATSDYPRAAFDTNGNILLAWRDGRLGDSHLYASLLNADGTTISDRDIRLDADIPGVMESVVSLFPDPTGGWALAWRFRNPEGLAGIAVARVEPSDELTFTTHTVVLKTRDASFRSLALTALNGRIALAWVTENDRIEAYVVQPGLRASINVDRSAISLPRYAKELAPALALTNGGDLLLSWGLEQSDCALWVARYAATDGSLASVPVSIDFVESSAESPTACAALPSVSCPDFDICMLIYSSFDPARPGIRLSLLQKGSAPDAPISITGADCVSRGNIAVQTIAENGLALAWMDARNENVYDIYTMRIDASGSPLSEEQRVEDSEDIRMSYNPRLSCRGEQCSYLWYDVDQDANLDRLWVRTQKSGVWSSATELAQLPRGYANGSYDITTDGTCALTAFHDYRHYTPSIRLASDTNQEWPTPPGREPGSTLIDNGHSSILDVIRFDDDFAMAFTSRALDSSVSRLLLLSASESKRLLSITTSDDFRLRRMRLSTLPDEPKTIQILMEADDELTPTALYSAEISPSQSSLSWQPINEQDQADLPVRASELLPVWSSNGLHVQALWQDVRDSQLRLFSRTLTEKVWSDEECLTCATSTTDRNWNLRKWIMSESGLLWIADGSGLVSAFFKPAAYFNPEQPQILLGRLEDSIPDIALAEDDPPIALLAWRDSQTGLSKLWAMPLSYDQDSLGPALELASEDNQLSSPELVSNDLGLWLATYWSVNPLDEEMTLKAVFSTDDARHWSPPVELPIGFQGLSAAGLVSLCANPAGFVVLIRRPDWYPASYQIFSLQPMEDGSLRIGTPLPVLDGTIQTAGSHLFCNPDLSVTVFLEAAPTGIYEIHKLYFP
jgi:hypothetical protein